MRRSRTPTSTPPTNKAHTMGDVVVAITTSPPLADAPAYWMKPPFDDKASEKRPRIQIRLIAGSHRGSSSTNVRYGSSRGIYMSVACPIFQHRPFPEPVGPSHLRYLARGAFAAQWQSGTAPAFRSRGPHHAGVADSVGGQDRRQFALLTGHRPPFSTSDRRGHQAGGLSRGVEALGRSRCPVAAAIVVAVGRTN